MSEHVVSQLRNDDPGSRLALLNITLAERKVLDATVWSRLDTTVYISSVLISAFHKVDNNTSGHSLPASKKLPALDGGIDPLKL